MKHFTLLILTALLSVSTAFSQSGNVILFTSSGEQFYAVLNGVRQNMDAQTNLKISDLNAPNYKLNIIFEDQMFEPMMGKNLYTKAGMEVTYQIKKNKKDDWVLRYQSEYPLAQAPATQAQTVVYTTVERPVTTASTVTETTTTTTGSEVAPGGESVGISLSMNVSENGEAGSVNMNMNIDDNMGQGSDITSTSTTTTTYTTTDQTTTTYSEPESVYTPGYSGAIGCPVPMSDYDFSAAESSVASKTFSDSKMTVAKQIATHNCLTASQVKALVAQFDFENDRLEFAQFAYEFTYDRGNYYQINDAFDFEMTIGDLDRYIERFNNR
jgi:hypothetical protein